MLFDLDITHASLVRREFVDRCALLGMKKGDMEMCQLSKAAGSTDNKVQMTYDIARGRFCDFKRQRLKRLFARVAFVLLSSIGP